MSRPEHYHVVMAQSGLITGVLEYEDGLESVQRFLSMFRSIYQSDNPLVTEMSLMENLNGDNQPIWAGIAEAITVMWCKCTCTAAVLYN